MTNARVHTPTPVHYLRANEREWTPRSLIFLDTETRTVEAGAREVQSLRLWVARYTDRKPIKKASERHVTGWGRTGNDLALWIDSVTRNRESVWLYAHNAGFDLSTTRLPLWLARHGWRINDAAVGGPSPWMRLSRGKRTLTILDSWSWLPEALENIGAAVRTYKPALPGSDSPEHEWLARCGADVDILATAILELMAWWDREKLGNWTITGAGCGWNAYRHTPSTRKVVIDPDPLVVKAERAYVHGGRRGTWTIGQHAAGPFVELDFTSAYPMIAAQLAHPVGRAFTFDTLPLDHPNLTNDRWGVTARVLIETDVPRWPVRIGRGSWYPVGRFWADLAGPDIREALRLGVVREIGPGTVHQLGMNMAPWARWVLAVQGDRSDRTPAVARMAAKNWGRAVIGKWSAHAYTRTALGPSPGSGWGYEEGWYRDGECEAAMVDLGGQRWLVAADGDPDNAYPAVTAWIEAEVRVRLGRAIAALGEGCVLQCDTDGMIVAARTVGTPAARGHLLAPAGMGWRQRLVWVLDQIEPVVSPLTLRIKNQHTHVEILGPQHVMMPTERRAAGMPRNAELQEDGTYQAHTWPGLAWQMGNGDARGYVRPSHTYKIEGPYPTGWLLADKRVVPVETRVTPAGVTELVEWPRTRYALTGTQRGDVQHRSLRSML